MKPCSVDGCEAKHEARGYCHIHYGRFMRHGNPLVITRQPNGAGWLDKKGYLIHEVDGHRVREHRAVVEQAMGCPLPLRAVVHHVDENRTNNSKANLVVCQDDHYHKILHRRMNALKATGDAHWRKCPYCGAYDDPRNMRAERSGRCVHRECSARARVKCYRKRKAICSHSSQQ